MPVAPYDRTGDGVTDAVLVGGTTFTVSADLTRPSNTTAYAQYDIIAVQASGTNVVFLEFDTGKVDSSGYITKARLETNRTAESAQYRLLLFRVPETGLTTRLTSLGDNDIFPLIFANRAHRIGYIDFTTWITGGSGSDSALSLSTDVRLKYGLASGASKLYGLLINLGAQTPASAQQYSVALSFESNS